MARYSGRSLAVHNVPSIKFVMWLRRGKSLLQANAVLREMRNTISDHDRIHRLHVVLGNECLGVLP